MDSTPWQANSHFIFMTKAKNRIHIPDIIMTGAGKGKESGLEKKVAGGNERVGWKVGVGSKWAKFRGRSS